MKHQKCRVCGSRHPIGAPHVLSEEAPEEPEEVSETERKHRWRVKNVERNRAYMRRYMKEYRARRKRERE